MSLLVLTAFRFQTSALSTKACSHSCDEGRMRENFWVQLLKVIVFSELVVGLEGFGGGRRGRACSRSVPSRLSIHAVQIIVVHARARRRCGGVASWSFSTGAVQDRQSPTLSLSHHVVPPRMSQACQISIRCHSRRLLSKYYSPVPPSQNPQYSSVKTLCQHALLPQNCCLSKSKRVRKRRLRIHGCVRYAEISARDGLPNN